LVDNGGNLVPLAPTLAFVIEDRGSGARVEWSDRPPAITAGEAIRLKTASSLGGERAGAHLECDAWLRTFLAGGLKPTIEVFKAGSAAGFSKDQIRRAKDRIRAIARREGFGGDGQWIWGPAVHASGY